MELVPPSATTTSTTSDPRLRRVPSRHSRRRALAPCAQPCSGLVGTLAIVVGAILGGQSFETHLAGAWFFGMPGGLFGSYGTDNALPTGRVPGARVRRPHPAHPRLAGLPRAISRATRASRSSASCWWCSSGPCRSCWRHRCSAATSTRMRRRARWSAITSTRTPMARASSARPRSTRWQTRCGRTQSRPTGRPSWRRTGSLDQASGHRSSPTSSCSGSWRSQASR